MQMCHDRGYFIRQDELDQTLEQFKVSFNFIFYHLVFQEQFGYKPSEKNPARSELTVLVAHNDDPTNQMCVFFSDDTKIGINTIKVILQLLLIQIFRLL